MVHTTLQLPARTLSSLPSTEREAVRITSAGSGAPTSSAFETCRRERQTRVFSIGPARKKQPQDGDGLGRVLVFANALASDLVVECQQGCPCVTARL